MLIALLFLFTCCIGVAFAGAPSLIGAWQSEGSAIFPDGSTVELIITADIKNQNGGLVSGSFLFTFVGESSMEFEADFTGYIDKGKNLKGVLSTLGFGTGVANANPPR